MSRRHRAFTLLEVMISLVIFTAVLVAVLQSMTSIRSYAVLDATNSDLEVASQLLENEVTNDFGNSGWFYQYDTAAQGLYVDVGTGKTVPLYPQVNAAKNQIEFLKLRTSLTVKGAPNDERYGFVNFNDPKNNAVTFDQFLDAKPTPYLILNDRFTAEPQMFVAPVWESAKVGLSFDQNQDPTLLRHYQYAVIPDPQSGFQQLVRQYSNGTSAIWQTDKVLASNVAKVIFETWKENSNLNQNQIRIFLTLNGAADAQGLTSVSRNFDLTASMRSITEGQ